jgi:4'-phosphopantetheinyl transferase EntD
MRQCLQGMLGDQFAVAVAGPHRGPHRLFPEERAHIATAAEKRAAEFATARTCARSALAAIGVPASSLVPHIDRSPAWPPDVKGSITHTHDICAVAVTCSPLFAAVGIDIEMERAVGDELVDLICGPDERAWLESADKEERADMLTMLFSAKEAFYKCQYPITKSFLDFRDVQLAIDVGRGCFRALEVSRPGLDWSFATAVRGQIRHYQGRVATTAVLSTDLGASHL